MGFRGLCLMDGPLAIRQADYASVYPAGLSVAASWDRQLARQRGMDMGTEFKGKGANVALGPVAGPLGRSAYGGRNWEVRASSLFLFPVFFLLPTPPPPPGAPPSLIFKLYGQETMHTFRCVSQESKLMVHCLGLLSRAIPYRPLIRRYYRRHAIHWPAGLRKTCVSFYIYLVLVLC